MHYPKLVPIFHTALLLTALAAQAAGWPVGHLHETSAPLSRLPQRERALVIPLLRPELGPLFQGESSKLLDRAIDSFTAERLDLNGARALALKATGEELCGATGNCSFWVVDLTHRRVLLKTVGVQQFTVERTKSADIPNIITSSQASATEKEMTRWRLQGSTYEAAECATIDFADDAGTALKEPRVTPHPCSQGN
jgi:hypothetical protein